MLGSLGARRLNQLIIPSHVTELPIAEDNDSDGQRAALLAEESYARPSLVIRRTPPPSKFKNWAKVLDAQSVSSRSHTHA